MLKYFPFLILKIKDIPIKTKLELFSSRFPFSMSSLFKKDRQVVMLSLDCHQRWSISCLASVDDREISTRVSNITRLQTVISEKHNYINSTVWK